MVQLNFAKREVQCKVVYYGPARSGKTTNLRYVHANLPPRVRGALTSIATDGDRTLFFDFLTLDLGSVAGVRTKVHVYAVPWIEGQNAMRVLVLEGADGVVFVADSTRGKVEENLAALRNLRENLSELGRELDDLPLVFQWNKRDLPGCEPEGTLREALDVGARPAFAASAASGEGVFATLKAITQGVLEAVTRLSVTSSAPALAAARAPAGEAPETASASGTARRSRTDEPVWAERSARGTTMDDFHKPEDLPPASEEPSLPPLEEVAARAAEREPDSTTSFRPRWHTNAPLRQDLPYAETARWDKDRPNLIPPQGDATDPMDLPSPWRSDAGERRRVPIGPPKHLRARARDPRTSGAPDWDRASAVDTAELDAAEVARRVGSGPALERRKGGRREADHWNEPEPVAHVVAGTIIALIALAAIGYLVFALL
jgi:signal recognition particle receptor subunit beta